MRTLKELPQHSFFWVLIYYTHHLIWKEGGVYNVMSTATTDLATFSLLNYMNLT